MKGILFGLGKDSGIGPDDAMSACMFGVWMPRPKEIGEWRNRYWSSEMLATIADYMTMSPGDKVFFFQNRLIYGIGEVVKTQKAPPRRGAILNYHDADLPNPREDPSSDSALFTLPEYWRSVRIVVPFLPSPLFFREGIDMDEVLSTPGADVCWSLRNWERKSFALLGDNETQLLIEVFLRRFFSQRSSVEPKFSQSALDKYISQRYPGVPSVRRLVRQNPEMYLDQGKFRNENTLHGLLIEHMMENDPSWGAGLSSPDRGNVFHEVPASPPKPPLWRDSMDILATRYWEGTDVLAHYDVVEAKAGIVDLEGTSFNARVSQVMRYVDFVAKNYAGGNYGSISAYYVAKDFDEDFVGGFRRALSSGASLPDLGAISRSYVLNPREREATHSWTGLNLLTYDWDENEGRLTLNKKGL